MKTICPNLECKQTYNIKSEMLGATARCKRCNTVFKLVEYIEPVKEITLILPEEPAPKQPEEQSERKRRTAQEVLNEKFDHITAEVNKILPLLMDSLEKKGNESDTRMLLDSILQYVLGYDFNEIKTEQKIEGRRADYVLSIKDENVIVLEAKKIGMTLRVNQIFQATAYGAYAGIKWVVLTNALVWQLYRISTGEKIEYDLVFTIDLLDGLDRQEAEYFYLISKDGMSRKNLLEQRWQKIRALSNENIINVLLDEEVLTKIRTTLTKRTGYKVTNEELRKILEENILELS